jgi:hypothetical protein
MLKRRVLRNHAWGISKGDDFDRQQILCTVRTFSLELRLLLYAPLRALGWMPFGSV